MSEPTRILIVDDSQLARKMARMAVKQILPAAEIVEAKDGQEALQRATEHKFEVALIDINMPGMDGISVAQELLKRNDGTRFALCTANIQETMRKRADALGIEFIAKPINSNKLKSFLGVEN